MYSMILERRLLNVYNDRTIKNESEIISFIPAPYRKYMTDQSNIVGLY